MRVTASAVLAALALLAAPASWPGTAAAQDAEPQHIVIATGAPNGVYFHVGRSICRMIERNAGGLTCKPAATAGSQYNLANLLFGAFELAVVQSDTQYEAYNRSGPYRFVDQDYGTLRSLFSLHSEAFTVVARRDAGVETFADLKGKRVNLGNPGSGHRATANVVMAAMGWTAADFEAVEELDPAAQVQSLCQDRVQALVFMVGNPNPSIGKAVGLCGARLIGVVADPIAELVRDTPYYTPVTIPEGTYPASPEPVTTFGVRATVVSSSEVPEEVIYSLVKAVFDDLDTFKDYHKTFQGLDPVRMVSEGLTAPLHEGALRYYREQGLR